MAFGTRQNLLGAAVGIMEKSEKWQRAARGAQPSAWNTLECTNALEEQNSGKFAAKAAPFWGHQELQQGLSGLGCGEGTEGIFGILARLARAWPQAGRRQGKEGRWPEVQAQGHPARQAGTGAALPQALLIKELLFLAGWAGIQTLLGETLRGRRTACSQLAQHFPVCSSTNRAQRCS